MSYTIAVVGATGLVGEQMLRVLEELNFPVERLIAIASEKSLGNNVRFRNEFIPIQTLENTDFTSVDIALFSAGASISKTWAKRIAEQGTVVIDNSSAWRMDEDVPLIVPEVNGDAVFSHKGIIANPNCSTIQMVVALQPLNERYAMKRVVVSTYQAVTGSGIQAVHQLNDELYNKNASGIKAYPHPIAFNCLPHIDVFFDDGYTKEEHKMVNETRKIMNLPNLPLTATCVRVPVLGGHSESVNVEFEKPFELNEVRNILSETKGIIVQDDPQKNVYPMPLSSHLKNDVFVGRLRRDETIENGLNMWIVSDNLRKGAATNTVQIAQLLIEKEMLLNVR